jgi:Xaa-Pro aminopeptidase
VGISVSAHMAVMAHCRAGLHESDLAGLLWQQMLAGGADYIAYPHIVAAGANACTLHYTRNRDVLQDGGLLLVDAGAEYQGYAGDITRTIPINGCFSADQQAIYELVLAAQLAVIAAIKPGVQWRALQPIAVQVLVTGLKDLAILTGDVDELIAAKAYQPFYMHGIGHSLGLDVHDVGGYGQDHDMVLQAGMVLTVEPGLYLNPELAPMLERWHHIGVRIEDDVLVTEDGCCVLSEALPKQANDVVAQMTAAKASG